MSKLLEQPIPPVLFKYVGLGDFIEKLIKGESLKFSSPLDFNDPFECSPAVSIEANKHGKNYLRSIRVPNDLTGRQKRALRKEHQKNVFNRLIPSQERAGIANLLAQTGICSLSETELDILMWSHYAEQHRGICIGFDTKKYFFQTAWPVKYQSNYPIVVRPQDDYETVLQKSLLTKSLHWSYECEWRIIRRTLSPQECKYLGIKYSGTPDSQVHLDQRGPGFYEFPHEAINQIIFGIRTPVEWQQRICQLLSSLGSNAKIYKLSRHNSKFELIKNPVLIRKLTGKLSRS